MMEKSFSVFDKYVKSERTRENYRYFFTRFMKWCKENLEPMITADGLLQLRESALQTMVEDYVMFLRKKISPNSFTPILASIQFFFSMNNKILNWDRIHKMTPERVKKSGYSTYQVDDVKRLLEGCGKSKRNRAIIHVMASTGCRVGALDDLKLKHVESMPEECKSILFYEGSTEEYYGFLTPEASKALDEYLQERRKDGEILVDESPLFRESYQVGIQKAKPMSLRAIKLVLFRTVKGVNRKKNGKRYDIMTSHGLRKRFATTIKMNKDIPYSVGERLLGHQVNLDPSYFRPTKENLFLEFKKAIYDLTISNENRILAEKLQLENKLKEQKDHEKTLQKLREDFEESRSIVIAIARAMKSAGINFTKHDGSSFADDKMPELYEKAFEEGRNFFFK